MRMEDGVMRMVAYPGGFDVPPRGTLKLEPGGKHVMLIEPRLPEGRSSLPLVLHFERGGKIEVEAELVEIGMDHAVDH